MDSPQFEEAHDQAEKPCSAVPPPIIAGCPQTHVSAADGDGGDVDLEAFAKRTPPAKALDSGAVIGFLPAGTD